MAANLSSESEDVLGIPGGLCSRAPLQLCRLTNSFGIHPACVAKPLLEKPIRIEHLAILIIGVLGIAVCFDRTRAVFGAGYTAVRAKFEYTCFFFILAVWNCAAILDHVFFTLPTTPGRVFVLVDACSGVGAAAALALAAVAELGTVSKSPYFRPNFRKFILFSVEAALVVVMALFFFATRPGLEVFWVLAICSSIAVYAILTVWQVVKKLSIRLAVLLALTGAIEVAALLCLFVFGVTLCQKISPHFGGEEIFHLLTIIAVWLFYFVYSTVKDIEAEKLKTITTADGEMIVLAPAKENEI